VPNPLPVFKAICVKNGAKALVGIALNGAVNGEFDEAVFTVKIGGVVRDATFKLDPVAKADANGCIEARIDLAQQSAKDAFAGNGLLGFKPNQASAVLDAVRIVIRPGEREGENTEEHPYFALHFDWGISASIAEGTTFTGGDAQIGLGADVTVATGLACIHPPGAKADALGVGNIRLRVDVDALAATTGWFPLPVIDPGLDLRGLLAWFGRLVGILPELELPDWSCDLRLPATLPFGLRFKTSHLILARDGGGYSIEGRASGLVLEWEGEEVFEYDDAELSLSYVGGAYILKVTVFAAQYPKKEAQGSQRPAAYSLPFGALSLTAQGWLIRAGLFGRQVGGKQEFCPELIIEAAEIGLSSSLWRSGEPLWQAKAARLHMRGWQVLTCDASAAGLPLFGDAKGQWFADYRAAKDPRVERLSDVTAAEDAQEKPEESSPIEFLDGSFDPEGHVRLLWKQDNARLFRKLAEIVPGLSRSGGGTDGQPHYVALELARFRTSGGDDLQARLEWRPVASQPLGPPVPDAVTPPRLAPGDEICSEEQSGRQLLVLPQGNSFKPIKPANPAFSLDLPLISLSVAEPAARSLLFYRPAGEAPAISFLHLYQGGTDAAPVPILHAALDFSLDDEGDRTLLPTSGAPAAGLAAKEEPFLELGLASRRQSAAIAVLSWQQGSQPKIVRAFQGQGMPFRELIPAAPPAPVDCRGCPAPPKAAPAPLALHPDSFRTPNPAHAANGWALAIRLAAERSLRSFFGDPEGSESLVKVTLEKICYREEEGANQFLPPLYLHTVLKIRLEKGGASEMTGAAVFRFDPADMSLRLVEGGTFYLRRKKVPVPGWVKELGYPENPGQQVFAEKLDLFGLEAHIYRAVQEGDQAADIACLQMELKNGRFAIGLAPDCHCLMRYADLGGGALNFAVEAFQLGPGGLDVEAAMIPGTLKVKGLSNRFLLEEARLSIVGSRLRRMSVAASGKLPEIMSFAPVRVAIVLGQKERGGRIELEELACQLANKDHPIVTKGVRYRFELTALSLRYLRETEGSGGRHFFFEISGSAQFEPKAGEFDGGLLENLKSARIEFTRAPLSDELTDHLSFMVELNKPVSFELFKIFRMEIRSIGFAPKHDFPGGEARPALIVGGQCEFADAGDIVSAEIDFHRLHIGLPRKGSNLPQTDCQDWRVQIRTSEGFAIGGTVAVYDEATRKGFKGDGFVTIPGLPQIGAAFAFMELRDENGRWKRAWFIAVEASKISYPVGSLPIYLRQVGLGFGYRMTSVMLREHEQEDSLSEILQKMLDTLSDYQTLARIGSWIEDVESSGPARFTVAAEAVFTLGSTQAQPFEYDAKKERKLRLFVLQMMAALRSDLSFVAAAKLWFPVSFDDFVEDRHGMRRWPMAKGFIHYSPRQQRLLAYARKEKNAYYGPPDDPLTQLARTVLEPVPYEVLALIEPSRLRVEIGWADRLVFQLKMGPLKIECRGGMMYGIENETAVGGLYFSARGGLGLSGGAGGGSLGLKVTAHAEIAFAARLMIGQPLRRPLQTSIYGQVGIDVNVRFSVDAWFRFKVGFVKVSLSLRFSISLQIIIALEVGLSEGSNLGFKGRARVRISVFGRGLTASVAVGLNEGAVDRARYFLKDYMDSLLEPGKIPPVPSLDRAASPVSANPALAWAGNLEELAEAQALAAGAMIATKDELSFAVIPFGAAAAANKRWLVWIIPSPAAECFYPLPPAEKKDWASFTVPASNHKLSVLDGSGVWKEYDLSAVQEAPLHCWPDAAFPSEDEDGKADQKLTLRKAIAGGWKLKQPNENGKFPLDFEGAQDELDPVGPEAPVMVIEDDRVRDGARHIDPELNPHNAYDRALAAAMELKEGDEVVEPGAGGDFWIEQARTAQGFLLRQFQDDIDGYVADHIGGSVTGKQAFAAADKASAFHTGLVMLIEGKDLPPWAASRGSTDQAKIAFGGDSYALRPVVELEATRFSGGNVVPKAKPIVHFDEELLAIHWKIGWRGESPMNSSNQRIAVEDLLRHYRVELFALDVGTAKPMAQYFVRPVDMLAKQEGARAGESKRVAIRPRYNFTVPTSEIFPEGGSQLLRQVMAVITPVSQAGDEGESFQTIAELEPRLTPLPADNAELILSYDPAGAGKFVAALKWTEPALPNRMTIASTDAWEVIIRKQPQVALGQYPRAADEAGGQLTSALALKPGDIILRLPKDSRPQQTGDNDGSADYMLVLPRDLPLLETAPEKLKWFDHLGAPIKPASPLASLIDSFRNRISAATGGYAWQLFLRALSEHRAGKATYSSIAQVRMTADLELAAAVSAVRAPATGKPDKPVVRTVPLPHLEWPLAEAARPVPAPQTASGPLHVPLLGVTTDGDIVAQYADARDQRRVVSVMWQGHPAAIEPSAQNLAANAGFHLFEADEIGLTNADLAKKPPTTWFGRKWVELAEFEAVDPSVAANCPGTLAETQKWQFWGPPQAALLRWLGTKAAAGIAVAPDARKSWYGWSDADLEWPLAAWSNGTGSKAEEPDESQANRHPLLAELVRTLREWADGEGYEFETATGVPKPKEPGAAGPPSRLDWLNGNTEKLDPFGFAALWHLGLGVELSARDRVSGRLVPQAVLLEKAGECLVDMLDGDGKLARHIAIDCPVRPNSGLAAKADESLLGDIALDRIQVSLRPVARVRECYFVLKIPDLHQGTADMPLPPLPPEDKRPQGIFIQRFDDATNGVGFIDTRDLIDAAKVLKSLLKANSTLLLKFEGRDFGQVIEIVRRATALDKGLFVEKWLVTKPLALGSASDCPIWPYGRFADSMVKPRSEDDPLFDTFCDYLSQTTIRDDEPDAKLPEAEKQEVRKIYRAWARRFFAVAPLETRMGLKWKDWLSAAAPRAEDTEMLAPARDRTYRYNRIVNWQWAARRSVRLSAVGRYQAFLAGTIAEPPRQEGKENAGFYRVSRTRRLEPPQIIGERLITSDEGEDYHELTLAIHEEETLAAANDPMQARLEFQGIYRRFSRRFLYGDWAAKFGSDYVMDEPDLEWDKVPAFAQSDAEFLAHAPGARLGATAMIFPCEAFFYETKIEMKALADETQSALAAKQLAVPSPVKTTPAHGKTLAAKREAVAWDAVLAADYEAWKEAIGPAEALSRWRLRIDVRFPRYFESLRGGRPIDKSISALPDNLAVLHLTAADGELELPLGMLRANERQGESAFDCVAVGQGLEIQPLGEDLEDCWTEKGPRLDVALTERRVEATASVAIPGLPVARTPLKEADVARLYEPIYLPAWGALASAAPLALRLISSADGAHATRVTLHDCFDASLSAANPLTNGANGTSPASEADLAAGIRLLLDPERMMAAKAAAYEGASPGADLAGAIEEAAGVACRVPEDAIPQARIAAWARHLRLWRLETEAGNWAPIENVAGDVSALKIIAIAREWSVDSEAQMANFLTFGKPADEDESRLGIPQIKQIADAAAALARSAKEARGGTVRLPPKGDMIDAWVQHGNQERAVWGKGEVQ
jgi:hypothetical protein